MIAIRLLLSGAFCAALLAPATEAATKKPTTKPATGAPTAAPVADPGPAKSLGTSGSWSAYVAQNKTGKICYLIGQPDKTDPAVKRKTVMATVTHRTEDQVSNVVSFAEGYPLNDDDDVTLDIGKDKFTLFAKGDSAWARTSDLDKQIVTALAKEKTAVVKGMPKKGHATADTYSLAGFGKALALIDKACDVKR